MLDVRFTARGVVIDAKPVPARCGWTGGCDRETHGTLTDQHGFLLCRMHAAKNANGRCECCGELFVPEYAGRDVFARDPEFPSAARPGAALCSECATA